MSGDDPRELIGPFVLGACTDEEAAQVRAHMVASAEFRAEVESFDDVHSALLDVPAVDVVPDDALKRSIMAQVQAEASLFAAAGPAERAAITRDHAEDTAATDPTPARGAGQPAPSPRRGAFLEALRHPARATALAAVLVALIVGGIVLGSGGGGGGSDDPQSYALIPTPKAGPNASGRLVADKTSSTLKLNGFPELTSDKRYQVWLQTGTEDPKPTDVLFSVDAKGHGEAKIPGDLSKVDQVLVTAEPKGGSMEPTTDPVLHVQI
ncbi:anti-sigma factor [Patulibacter sp. NPDC049589]|uniref:anti-sigma factor n=1 Tax=Patulibacter sp. NPDC049589 TaxID=3154731 RepID=UPI00343E8F79